MLAGSCAGGCGSVGTRLRLGPGFVTDRECPLWISGIIARFRNYTRFRNYDSETTIRKLFRAIQKLIRAIRKQRLGNYYVRFRNYTIRKLLRTIRKLRLGNYCVRLGNYDYETTIRKLFLCDSETTIRKLLRTIKKLRLGNYCVRFRNYDWETLSCDS